jgi:hypothetical protein
LVTEEDDAVLLECMSNIGHDFGTQLLRKIDIQ